MKFKDLYKSVFAILRVEGTQAKVVGTGFVINTNPLYILTCNHVVGEGNETNNGVVRYSITKRSDLFDNFDIRQVEISFLAAKKITRKPEFDLAILEVDPSTNKDISNKLDIQNTKKLKLSFNKAERKFGSAVEWLSTAASGDLTLTPRFFNGSLITSYTADHNYKYKNNLGVEVQQRMSGVSLIEVDKLFIPGSSGSPILDIKSNKVIGYVHGFKSWPIFTNTEIEQRVEIIENANPRNVGLKYALPLVASLSLGIDLRTIESYLETEDFIGPRLVDFKKPKILKNFLLGLVKKYFLIHNK